MKPSFAQLRQFPQFRYKSPLGGLLTPSQRSDGYLNPENCRSAYRLRYDPSTRNFYFGFRLCYSVE